ncbi:hypothetical protein RUM43_012478 [Polyplax serrata]|uniref:Uncharacterized protein n=1 Tax=Polyplax serrata TaxID=468196 RepID=A0AAN8RZF3_POLSC
MMGFLWNLKLKMKSTYVNSETTAYPEIPKHLLECYMNDGIYHRANRLPNSYESFIDLLYKIEDSPTGRNINARELSLVLLHYLKLDGIQSVQSHTKISSNILPFAPSGDEYFKHRLILIGLVTRIDQSYMAAINESLTAREMCNLHFMLSYSIDPYKRENERCSPLYEEVRSRGYGEPRADWNPFQSVPGYNPYDIRDDRFGNGNLLRNSMGKREIDESRRLHRKRVLESLRGEAKIKEKDIIRRMNELNRRRRDAEDKKADVEIISVEQSEFQNKETKITEKDKFTIGDHVLLGENENHPRGHQSLVQGRPDRFGGRSYPNTGYPNRGFPNNGFPNSGFPNSGYPSNGYPNTGYPNEGSVYSGVQPGVPLSDCPAINGIITTPYGSLAIGHVIAGLAAGLNPEEIPPGKLSVNLEELENQRDMVSNIWATTLAGTVADTISTSALAEMDDLQILKGGWNESTNPKWYLLKNDQYKHLTEVSLRGSLDGLFLGLSAKELSNKYSNFKLSQLLQIYYEYFWDEIGAKNRVMMRPQYAPDEIFRKQVHLMSLVLKRQKTNVVTVLNHDRIARDAVTRVTNFIHNMDDKSNSGRSLQENVDLKINMVAVVDASWTHDVLLRIFETLRISKVAATPHQSNLTIVCGADGKTLMHADNSIDLNKYFTKEKLMDECARGMNFIAVFESVEFHYRRLYQEEETSKKMNTDAQVVVLFPYETFLSDNQELTTEKSLEFQRAFPDVRLVIAANGRTDGFTPLVKDTRNLFAIVPSTTDPNMKTVKDLADGIEHGFQRISRPSCGSYFDDDSQGTEIRVTREVFPEYTTYYRVIPQYFFRSRGTVTISIRSKQRVPLTVCHSRDVERPEDNKSRRPEVPSPSYPHSGYNKLSSYDSEYSPGKN